VLSGGMSQSVSCGSLKKPQATDSKMTSTAALSSKNISDNQEEGVLFIDNSNIFIEGKKFYAKQQKLRVRTDPCFRIDIGKLCQALLNGRKMSYGKLYGSEPPDLDTLWSKIREGGLEVDKFERNYKGEEKEVDNALSSDATAYACENKRMTSCETIIFLAGDRDYCPAVENILRRGWNVEVAAFSFSMSSKMKGIARTNKHLKIVELDELLKSYEPCPYYVNRQWRPLRTNYTHRRIPRENTKVFSFKREFDVDNKSDVMNVRKLADIIASLVRIPCNFYCHRINEKKSRTVFIIFLLRLYGKDAEHDTKGEKRSWAVNLDQAWNDCKGMIDIKCKDIFDQYELDKYEDAVRFIQSTHTTKSQEQMEMTNAFSNLSLESLPWSTECEEDKAGNVDDMNDSDDDDDIELNEPGPVVDSEDPSLCSKDYTVAKRKPDRIHTTSSVPCKYSFNCNHALCCKKKHSKLEREFFRHYEQQGLVKKGYYKSKPCYGYIKRNCNTGNREISPCCSFYHSLEESRCYYCTSFSGELGHQATQECADRVDKPYFLSVESR